MFFLTTISIENMSFGQHASDYEGFLNNMDHTLEFSTTLWIETTFLSHNSIKIHRTDFLGFFCKKNTEA